MHGNTKRLPANSLPKEDIDYLITFITNYASAHGVPLPGRVPGHRDKVLVLPADITKITVYSKYKQACSLSDLRVAGKSTFYQVWQEILPHISVSTPRTDLCFTCQKNNLAIQRSACLSNDEKVQCLTTAEEHLFLAQSEREYYNTQVKRANESLCTLQQGEKTPLSHYSFDFAQQVRFPFSAHKQALNISRSLVNVEFFGYVMMVKTSK